MLYFCFVLCFVVGLLAQLLWYRAGSLVSDRAFSLWGYRFDAYRLPQLTRLCFFVGAFGLIWDAFGVEIMLLVLTVGIVSAALVDKYFLEPRRDGKPSTLEFLTFSRDVWVFLLALFVVRNFVVQHYRVPTGSLEPTVKPGDFLLVHQFSYGWHIPVVNTPLLSWGKPKMGDIAVFRYPKDPLRTIYVKRVIGVPGDKIVYRNKQLTINGKRVGQEYVGMQEQLIDQGRGVRYLSQRREYLPGHTHDILVNDAYGAYDDVEITVPEGTYYMMGDNRDNSLDSRYFGPVSEDLLVGRALVVLFGWSSWLPSLDRMGLWL